MQNNISDIRKESVLNSTILHNGVVKTLKQFCLTDVKSVYIKENEFKIEGSKDYKLIDELEQRATSPILRKQNETLKSIEERIERIKNKKYYKARGMDGKEYNITKIEFDFCKTLNK